jgi:hypothetical protein
MAAIQEIAEQRETTVEELVSSLLRESLAAPDIQGGI